jgi:hypothetical protein
METAIYYDKATKEVISGQTLLDRTLTQNIDFSSHPSVQYTYNDSVEVKPMHF